MTTKLPQTQFLSFKLHAVVMAYLLFISTSSSYGYLTITSEVLNAFRGFAACYALKVVVDMHREMIKINLFN